MGEIRKSSIRRGGVAQARRAKAAEARAVKAETKAAEARAKAEAARAAANGAVAGADARRAAKRAHGERGPDKGVRSERIEAVHLREKGYATAFAVARAEGVAFTTVRRRVAKGLIPGKQLDALGNETERAVTNKHWYVHLPRYVAMLDTANPSRAAVAALAAELGIELAPKGRAPVMDLG